MESGRSSTGLNESSKKMQKQLSAAERQEFKQLFDLVDVDGDGTMDTLELQQLMLTLGIRKDVYEVEEMVQDVQPKLQGKIDFEEFCGVMSSTKAFDVPFEKMVASFEAFETKPGWIDMKELKASLKGYGTLSLKELASIADPTRDPRLPVASDVRAAFRQFGGKSAQDVVPIAPFTRALEKAKVEPSSFDLDDGCLDLYVDMLLEQIPPEFIKNQMLDYRALVGEKYRDHEARI